MGIAQLAHLDRLPDLLGSPSQRAKRTKRALLVLAGVRAVLAVVALALIPVFSRHDFAVLLVLRPSMGLLLVGAILARHGDASLWSLLAAAVPMQMLTVWLYYLLGRAWRSEIHGDDKLPFVTAQLLQRSLVRRLRRTLRARGAVFVALARFAVFPTGLLAATAGSSGMSATSFFPVDAGALVVASGLVVGAGYGLGLAERSSQDWLLGIGLATLLVLSALLTWRLTRQPPGRSR